MPFILNRVQEVHYMRQLRTIEKKTRLMFGAHIFCKIDYSNETAKLRFQNSLDIKEISIFFAEYFILPHFLGHRL